MTLETIGLISMVLASVPASMTLINLLAYRAPKPRRQSGDEALPAVSILIPARNEESSIGRSVEAALASRGVDFEIVVLDDDSEDGTAEIVRQHARRDRRVRLESASALPAGWCGKQYACHCLAQAARNPVLLFMDADVRLESRGVRRLLVFLERSRADLISGVPRQETGTLLEKLVVPLIHFVLLGFLPIPGMRLSKKPSFAAGCGQLFMTRRESYAQAGGHRAIRGSRHDGIMLPRAFRQAGLRTDLCDATSIAACRMYRSASEVWRGFAKNATEGMATPGAIVPWTVLLLGGQVLPPLVVVVALIGGASAGDLVWLLLASAMAWGTRLLLALRFRQSLLGVLLHPVGVTMVLAIQWYALLQKLMRRGYVWKGRAPVEGT